MTFTFRRNNAYVVKSFIASLDIAAMINTLLEAILNKSVFKKTNRIDRR